MFSPAAALARCTAALLLAAASLTAFAQASAPLPRPSLESFFNNPQFAHAALSPSGKLLAVIEGGKGKRDGLTVIDLSSRQVYTAARFVDVDIRQFEWVNDQRLVFDTIDKQLGPGNLRFHPGLFAANYDGSKLKQLTERRGLVQVTDSSRGLLPYNTSLIMAAGVKNPDAVYVTTPKNGGQNSLRDLLLLDTYSGRGKRFDTPEGTRGWVIDNQGEPRMALVYKGSTLVFHYREAGGEWRELPGFKRQDKGDDGMTPLGFGPGSTIYVSTTNGKDKAAVYAFDAATGKLSDQPLVNSPEYDFMGVLSMDKERLLGFRMVTDAESTIWTDPTLKALQDEVDQRLDSTVNLVTVPRRPETPWVLVQSYSDLRPRTFLAFNRVTKAIVKVGDSKPDIVPAHMGRQETVHYKARDGRDIPALLTIPAGAERKGLPLVMLVHGGPHVRGNAWGWNSESQFLASRGYAVLEPSFRGSTGLGTAHYKAGWKQWGLGMQNDLADGAKWAVAQGIVDPKRMCIAGSSYGGYAALMGLVNDSDLFKCGINWIGVTDIDLLYTSHWGYHSDLSEYNKSVSLPMLVGDPVKDAEQLKATSPLVQASRIRQPLLMAYGEADRRVPIYHGIKLRDAVKKNNKDVEWVVYPEEGHGWVLPKTRVDFWGRVEKFLERNIGKP